MSFRLIIVAALLILLMASTHDKMACAQQNTNAQGQPLMSTANNSVDSPQETYFINHLNFKAYEAALSGDTSACAGDPLCFSFMKEMKIWQCADAACEGGNSSKSPSSCFENMHNYSAEQLEQLNNLFCPVIKSPGSSSRQALFSHLSNVSEDHVVEDVAYILALKNSRASCEGYIKEYVGPYGPQWSYKWYRALSGCGILSNQTTRVKEEADFATWLGITQGVGNCSAIANPELRNACSAPGAASVLPPKWV